MALLYILVLALTATKVFATPVEPRADAEEEYRLPQNYVLSAYQLSLVVPGDSFTNRSNDYSGSVTIRFEFRNVTDHIALHAHHDSINLTSVTFNRILLEEEDYSVNDVTNILTINLVNPVTTGRIYALSIGFTGRLSTTNMYGFYRSSYVDKDGATQYLATTQFEPAHAREAFPCFDEPGFKATFDVAITYPSNLQVLSNTKVKSTTDLGGSTLTVFEQTPKMSTYLLAFIVSKFTCTPGDSIGEVPYQVCSRNESADARNLALDVGPKLIATLNDFTKYNYGLSNGKIDLVAIPDFAPGAMENWGLVTYREAALLWNENESSNRYQQRAVTVMSHELSHQWFGDLVTCGWWSDIFLNEGFASYFEYHIAHEVLPSWELNKQFVIEELQYVLQADALPDSLALESTTTTPTDIGAKFGSISYDKGGSVLRMVKHVMGADNFQAGLQTYLMSNKLGNAFPEDLWTALDTAKASVSKLPLNLGYEDVMDNWIKYPGFPLLTVTSGANNTVTVTQLRFLIGNGTAYEWFVPVSYTTSVDDNKFENTLPNDWLVPSETLEITLPENAKWIILNNQQTGYYRVNYDDTIWDAISTALSSENFDGIVDINRAQIIDDLFNLAKASRIPYTRVFEITGFLANDTSYYSWYPALDEYKYLLQRVGENSPLGKAIGSSLISLMNNFYESVPISKLNASDQIYTHKQVLALTWACKLGHEQCVTDTQQLFSDYKKSTVRPDRNLRAIVYCNGLRYSEDSTDWDFLWDAYTKSADLPTEQVTILTALGCTRDVDLLKGYLAKTITDGSGIRPQDATAVFTAVYSGNAEGVAVAYDFLTKNYLIIPDKYQNNVLPTLIKGVSELFTTEEEINNLKNFVANAGLPEDFKTAAQEAADNSERNFNWLSKFEKELSDFYNLNAVGKVNASLLVILLALIIRQFL